jgi:hypothetical protein
MSKHLQHLDMYWQVSILKHHESPQIWVAAGEGCSFLERFSYMLSEMPSKGSLFSEQDRSDIKVSCNHKGFLEFVAL